MEKIKSLLQTSLERIRLQQEVYDLYRVQNLPIDVVKEKTGLSRESIYRYLRNFVSGNPNVAEQMKKRGTDITAQGGLSVAGGCRCLTKELDMIAC